MIDPLNSRGRKAEAVRELVVARGQPVPRQHVGAAAGGAEAAVGDVEAHHQLVAGPQIALRSPPRTGPRRGGGWPTCAGQPARARRPAALAGDRIGALEPAAVGAQPVLLRHEIRQSRAAAPRCRASPSGCGRDSSRADRGRTTADRVNRAGQREQHADPRQIGQRLGNANAVPVRPPRDVVGTLA